MAAAVRAMNLGSDHTKGPVNGCLDSPLDRIIEAGPAGSAFEFSFGFVGASTRSASTTGKSPEPLLIEIDIASFAFGST
jgi:hypothetical protein